jgi:hypothetical protein
MEDKGWRKVRAITSKKPDGTPVSILVGMVRDDDGHLSPAIRIDDGPVALIPLEQVGAEVLSAIRKTLLDWYERESR